ncbi:MAG: Mrp/NBP35 family ATP-binding protein [Bacteroidetes bacterium]|nr:Mrp/NBP35 family ATP-binding protein [Bacteroidota bacterium]
MFTKEIILDALRGINHPDTGLDIVSSGMVGTVSSGENGITVVLTPDKSNDPVISSLRSTCVKVIKEKLGPGTKIADIRIEPKVVVEKLASVKKKTEDDPLPGVANILAVSSGKGGVGKSTIAVNLAVSLARLGYRTGLLDADIFGPSVPVMFDAAGFRPKVIKLDNTDMIVPMEKYGVKVLSIGFFVDPSDAVVWRGPMASNFLKQLITQGDWGELDYLVVDLPPGTSDIHLTLVQEVPVTGAIVVTTPQEVALADAVKGIAMFRSDKINVPVLGLVENMSWFTPAELPDNKYFIFGREGGKNLAEKSGVPLLGQIPVVQSICEGGDSGQPVALGDSASGSAFMKLAEEVVVRTEERNRTAGPTARVKIN